MKRKEFAIGTSAPKRAEIRNENLFFQANISLFHDHIDLCSNTLSQVASEFPALKDKLLCCFEGGSMENRVLGLSSLLVKTYNIKDDRSLLKKLVAMSKESELMHCLNPITFWMLHLLGTIKYNEYVALVDFPGFASFMSSIMSATDTTDKNTIIMRKYNKKCSITSEILLYLLDIRQFNLLHAIVYLDHSSSHEASQSDIFTSNIHPKPYILSVRKLTILLDIASVLQKHHSCALLEEWKCQNAKRLLSSIITTATSGSSCKDIVMKVIDLLTPAHLLKEIEKELRSSSDSVFDFTFMIWLKKQIELMKESFLFITFEQPNLMRNIGRLANNVAYDGVSEESVPLWLRSLFLVEQMSLFSDYLNLAHTNGSMHGDIRFSEWIDDVLGPKTSFLNPEVGPGVDRLLASDDKLHCVIYNQRNIAFICCASLEIIDKLSDMNLKVLCNQLRARHQLNKDSIDVFINTSRSRIQKLEQLRTDDIADWENKAIPDIDVSRIKLWWESLQRTKSLPLSISQTVKMNGRNGSRAILHTFMRFILLDPSIKKMCYELVSAMVTSSPPLCSERMANVFLNYGNDALYYESLALPLSIQKHVADAIKYIQQMQELMSTFCLNVSKSSEFMDASSEQLMHQHRAECFGQWKQAVKLSLASDDAQVNIKVASALTTNIMQSAALLSKLVLEYNSNGRARPDGFSMYSFLNRWSDWFRDVLDIIGDHDLIISSIVGIMVSKEGVGEFPSAVDGAIANSSSIGFIFSLLEAPIQMKLLNNLFLRYSSSRRGAAASSVFLQNVLGYMFYSLSWSTCLLCCRGSDVSMQVEKVLDILQGCAILSQFSQQYGNYLRLASERNSLVSCVFMWLYYYLQEAPTKCVTSQISRMYQQCSELSDGHHVNVSAFLGNPALSFILECEMTYFYDLFAMISISHRTACYYKLYGILGLANAYDRCCTEMSGEVAHQLWNAATNLLCGTVEKANAYKPGNYTLCISGASKNLVACVVGSLVSHVKATFLTLSQGIDSSSVISAQKNAIEMIAKVWIKSCKHTVAMELSSVTVKALLVLVARDLLILCATDNSVIDCVKWFLWLVHGNHAIMHNISLDFSHTIEVLARNCIPSTSFPLYHVCDGLCTVTSSDEIMLQDALCSMPVAPNVDVSKWNGCNTRVILHECVNITLMLCKWHNLTLLCDSLKNSSIGTSISDVFPERHARQYIRIVGWVLVAIILLRIKNEIDIKTKLPILLQYFEQVFAATDRCRVYNQDLALSMTSSCMLLASTESMISSSSPWMKSNAAVMLELLITHTNAQCNSLNCSVVVALRQELESQLPRDEVDDILTRQQILLSFVNM